MGLEPMLWNYGMEIRCNRRYANPAYFVKLKFGAEYRVRTDDPLVGNEKLYH